MASRRFLLGVLVLVVSLPLAAQVSFNSTTYSAPANTSPGYTISADIDRDGNPDVISTDGNPQLLVWYGTGAGKFGSAEIIGNLDGPPGDIAVGDFNGDGKLDIVTTTGQSQAIDVLINDGNRSFSKSSISTADWPSNIAVADFNHDGKLDLAVSFYKLATATNYIQIYFGNGDGTFTAGSQTLQLPYEQAYYVFTRDLNKDGKVDLLDVGSPATIFLNNGDGTFTASQTLTPPGGGTYTYGAIGDFNGDTAPDLFLTNNQFCGEGCGWIMSLDSWVNDGTGHFTLKQSLQPVNASSVNSGVLGDLNYDGKLDMVFWADNTLEYALGKGTGSFNPAQQWGPLNAPYGGYYNPILAHDLNNNGLSDVVSTDADSIQVLLNTTAKPDCVPPNSSSIGATVCSLVSGQKVNSTFPVRAAANGPVDIWRMEEWLDGKKVYQALSNQLRNNLTTTVGSHTLTISTVDVLNNVAKKTVSFTAISCTAPASAGVRICIPASGSTDSSPVSVVAASSPASGTSIVSVRLYVDSVAKYTTSGSRMSTSVSLSAGTHHLSVVAYEKNGGALKTSETITVH